MPSGIARIERQIDGGARKRRAVTATVTGTPHTLRSQVVDLAGNASTWRTDNIDVGDGDPGDPHAADRHHDGGSGRVADRTDPRHGGRGGPGSRSSSCGGQGDDGVNRSTLDGDDPRLDQRRGACTPWKPVRATARPDLGVARADVQDRHVAPEGRHHDPSSWTNSRTVTLAGSTTSPALTRSASTASATPARSCTARSRRSSMSALTASSGSGTVRGRPRRGIRRRAAEKAEGRHRRPGQHVRRAGLGLAVHR